MGLWEFGSFVCTACVLVMLAQLAIQVTNWVSIIIINSIIIILFFLQTILHLLSFLLSLLLYFTVGFGYSSVCSSCQGKYSLFITVISFHYLHSGRVLGHAEQHGGHEDPPGHHTHTHTVYLAKV